MKQIDKHFSTVNVLTLIQKKKLLFMFGLFKKDPIKKLEKNYLALMEKAMEIQRSGDLKHYAKLIEESEMIQMKIQELRNGK